MDDDPRSLVLVLLKRLNRKVDRLVEDVRDVKRRLTAVEERLAGVENSVARVRGDLAEQSRRIDALDARLARIERGLDPQDDPAPYRS